MFAEENLNFYKKHGNPIQSYMYKENEKMSVLLLSPISAFQNFF